jgi:adenylosuccinate synthase
MPGWAESTVGTTHREKLPKKAQEYLCFLQKETDAKIGIISTGPEREQTIWTEEFTAAVKS